MIKTVYEERGWRLVVEVGMATVYAANAIEPAKPILKNMGRSECRELAEFLTKALTLDDVRAERDGVDCGRGASRMA